MSKSTEAIIITKSGNLYKILFIPGLGGKIGPFKVGNEPIFSIISIGSTVITEVKRIEEFLGNPVCYDIIRGGKVTITSKIVEVYQKID